MWRSRYGVQNQWRPYEERGRGGLAFASILTLIAAPVFYYLMFPKARAERPEQSEARPKALTTAHQNENHAEAYPLAAE